MQKIKPHISIILRTALLWFVLFSISPCTVKQALAFSLHADYTRPLNKSKTTAQISGCSYSAAENRQTSIRTNPEISQQAERVFLTGHSYAASRSPKASHCYSSTTPGSSPPKYILYKRLKVDIA